MAKVNLLIIGILTLTSQYLSHYKPGDGNKSLQSGFNKNTAEVSGNISGVTSGYIIICYGDAPGKGVKIDSVRITNGNFVFTAQATYPRPFLLGLRLNVRENKGFIRYTGPFLLDTDHLNVKGAVSPSYNISASGTKSQDEYNEFKRKWDPLNQERNAIYGKIINLPKKEEYKADSLNTLQKAIGLKIISAVFEHIKKHPNSITSAYIFKTSLNRLPDYEAVKSSWNALSNSVKKSIYGKQIFSMIAASSHIVLGQALPGFTLRDGENIPISPDTYKGKFLLINFWASWCGSCRQENPALKKIYTKYKSNGFEIVGISLDRDKQAWRAAIKADGITWKQLIDIRDTLKSVKRLYGITEIPYSILLSPEGLILAKNLTPIDLGKKLESTINITK